MGIASSAGHSWVCCPGLCGTALTREQRIQILLPQILLPQVLFPKSCSPNPVPKPCSPKSRSPHSMGSALGEPQAISTGLGKEKLLHPELLSRCN